MLVNKLRIVVAIALMACVLGLGLGSRYLSGPAPAEGAQPAHAREEAADEGEIRKARKGNETSNWEYKVVTFASVEDEKATKQLNDLAAEGWHYVGLLTTGTQQITGGGFGAQKRSGPAVIFKRGKEGAAAVPGLRRQ